MSCFFPILFSIVKCALVRNPPHGIFSDAQLYSFRFITHPITLTSEFFNFIKSFMMKLYSHHTFSVQSPHTMDAILFRDVKIRNCGYRPIHLVYVATRKIMQPKFSRNRQMGQYMIWLLELAQACIMLVSRSQTLVIDRAAR